ncbi:MAG TPA: flagellar biosynthesis protein FlhB [Candidatus Wallbacteria bacterium]|nr:flagellar biosynthesis protein FlhB [Candidatus Wallbacteria bacterium]
MKNEIFNSSILEFINVFLPNRRPETVMRTFDELSFVDFDLQLFADDSPTGQRTEPATPRRREKAREEGQVAKSADLSAMFVVTLCFVMIYYSGSFSMKIVAEYMKTAFSDLAVTFDDPSINRLIIDFVLATWLAIAPVMLTAFIAALVVNFYQVGFYFSAEPLMFNITRFNPVNGMAKIFSKEPLFELIKSTLKVLVVIYIPYSFFTGNISSFSKFMGMEIGQMIGTAAPMLFEMSLKILMVLMILAIIDYTYQYFEFEKKIMMSKYDIKQEYKQEEGDPYLKQEMRRRARKIATGQMIREVPKAKVIVTNPTHLSIAIAYEGPEKGGAPTIVAKGADFIALKIREIAKENDIPLCENKPLARELYEKVEVGESIPEELYEAIAQVFAFVYRQKGMINR